MKGWIGIDLDGTLAHHYWNGRDVKFDPLRIGKPIPRMVEKVKIVLERHEFDVWIFTARVAPPIDHVEELAIRTAIRDYTYDLFGEPLEATCVKDKECVAMWDDRARQVVFNEGRFVDEV